MTLLIAIAVPLLVLGVFIALATGAPHYRAVAAKEAKLRKEAQHRAQELQAALDDIADTAGKAADVYPYAVIITDRIKQLEEGNVI